MASPTIDGHANNHTWPHLATSGTISLTTANANDVLELWAIIENTAAAISISSITSTSGLSWARRTTQNNPSNHVVVEEWFAPSALALTGEVITVNLSGAPDSVVLVACGVSGAALPSAPFDSNGALPSVGIANGSTPTMTITTSSADDLLFAFFGTNNSAGTTPPTGWTLVDLGTNTNAGGLRTCVGALFSKSVSATQSALSVTSTGSGTNNILVGDAITADSAAFPQNVTGVTYGDVSPGSLSLGVGLTGVESDMGIGVLAPALGEPDAGVQVGAMSAGTLSVSMSVNLQGVEMRMFATPLFLSPPTYFGVTRAMSDAGIGVAGAMSDDPVCVMGAMPPGGILSPSLAVFLEGVQMNMAVSPIPQRRNVSLTLTGVSMSMGFGTLIAAHS